MENQNSFLSPGYLNVWCLTFKVGTSPSSCNSPDFFLKKKRKTRGKLPQTMSQMKRHFLRSTRAICLACLSPKTLKMGSVCQNALCRPNRAWQAELPSPFCSYLPIPFKQANSWRNCCTVFQVYSVSRSVVSGSLQPHGLTTEFSRQEYWSG